MTTQQTKTAVFTDFSRAVAARFAAMSQHDRLYTVNLEPDELWDAYQAAWPAGYNEIYRKRREHDCSCCRAFIRQLGGVVSITDYGIDSIWDNGEATLPFPYTLVAAKMREVVYNAALKNVWLTSAHIIGTAKSLEQMLDGHVQTWTHFCVNVPGKFIKTKDAIPTALGEYRATYDVMLRSLQEITVDALDTVLELTAQNTLYRGSEFGGTVRAFKKLKTLYDAAVDKPLFVWANLSPNHRIRNTAIGTLLVDLSEGVELEDAVRKWEGVMAPTNYRRPTALVTKQMISKAKEEVEQLGLTSALERRYATVDDITVNDLLYVDRSVKVKGSKNAFDALAATVKIKTVQSLDELTINDFLLNVLPNVNTVELMVETKHAGNFCSLIAPVDATARQLFKWDNAFSWSYAGDVTDSIKARVKAAGGSVTGDLRCSLSWFNYDDLDLRMAEPGRSGALIYYGSKLSRVTGGQLDVDMNAGSGRTRSAVENITYPDRLSMSTGDYILEVNQYSQRETSNVGFEVEVEFDGQVFNLSHAKALRGTVTVATISYDAIKRQFTLKPELPSSNTSKEAWGVKTHTFIKVNAIMHSPNYWDGAGDVGNKHFMFMLDGCKNPDTARGFYNEFLTDKLIQHRKVLEMVGAHMQTEQSDQQLSGLGFSSTQRNSVVLRCTGSFTRTIKVNF